MYVCQLSMLQLLIWASYRHFKERLPEAICCCLQTCNVDVVLLVIACTVRLTKRLESAVFHILVNISAILHAIYSK